MIYQECHFSFAEYQKTLQVRKQIPLIAPLTEYHADAVRTRAQGWLMVNFDLIVRKSTAGYIQNTPKFSHVTHEMAWRAVAPDQRTLKTSKLLSNNHFWAPPPPLLIASMINIPLHSQLESHLSFVSCLLDWWSWNKALLSLSRPLPSVFGHSCCDMQPDHLLRDIVLVLQS